MPNILDYQPRTQVQQSSVTPYARPLTVPGNALEGLSEALTGFQDALQKREDEQARAWAIDAVSNSRLTWTQRLNEAQANAELGAPNFSQNFVKEFDAYAAEALKTAPNESAKKYFHERLADIRTSLGEKALTFEAGARVDYRDTKFDNAIDAGQKTVAIDPTQFKVVLAEQLAIIDSSALPPKARADKRQQAITGIARATIWAEIQRNPTAFLEKVQTGGVDAPVSDAYDILPFDVRNKLVADAITLNNQIHGEAERAAQRERKQKGDEYMKAALSRLDPQGDEPRLDRKFVEEARPWIEPAEYKSLLKALHEGGLYNDGSGGGSDPEAFREVQTLLYRDPDAARSRALMLHRNGHLSNSDLSSVLTKSNELGRTLGPKSEYERSRLRIVNNLDPGPYVQDPIGKARFAEALYEFDSWMEGGKRSDEEIRRRGEEITKQYKFVDLTSTAAGLPQPRFGGAIPRGGDPAVQAEAVRAAMAELLAARRAKKISDDEYFTELSRLNKWRDNAQKAAQQGKQQ